jgi:hypothetical protein
MIMVLGGSLRAADPLPVVPVKITGYIGFIHNDSDYLEMMVEITQGGVKMAGLDVRLNGQPAREISGSGYNYECRIAGVNPKAAPEVSLTVAKKSPLGSRSTPFITAKGKVTSLLLLTSPRDGGTISPYERGVTVAYEGGMPPYRFGISRVSDWVPVEIPGGCPPMGCFVPMSAFSPGSQYSFWLFAPVGTIAFTGPVHPTSSILLRQHLQNRITISPLRRDG